MSAMVSLSMWKRRLYRDPVILPFLVLVPLREQIDQYVFVLIACGAGEKHLHDPVIGADAIAAEFVAGHVSGAPCCR
jgi:hypothetical protein